MLTLACNSTVLFLRVSEHRLVALGSVAKMRCPGDEEAARKAYRTDQFEWRMAPPRTLLPSRLLCEQDDAMDFALSLCVSSVGELEGLLKEVRSGRISAVSSRFPSTWKEWAGLVYTFLVVETIVRIDAHAFLEVCRINVQHALTRPPPSKLRSWPPKKLFGDLKKRWEAMDVEQRVRMTLLSSREYWFIQACDFATVNATLRTMESEIADVTVAGLETARKATDLLTHLEVKVEPVLELFLSAAFVMQVGCLDKLYQKASWHATEKDVLLRHALCFPNDALFHEKPVLICAMATASWTDLDRVVSTLLLEGILQRYAMEVQFEQARAEHEEKIASEAELSRQAASKKRQERKRAKRLKKTQALTDDEPGETSKPSPECSPDDSSLPEEDIRLASTSPDLRTFAAALSLSTRETEKMDVEREEVQNLPAAGRQLSSAERTRTLKLLATAPSWDVSCLQVRNTFIDVQEEVPTVPRSQTPDVEL